MAKTLDKPSLYNTDYFAWLEEQMAHLRATRLDRLDAQNVADELESLLLSERRQLENRLETLILHLLKWDHQPDQRCNRWRVTVQRQRSRIRRLLRDSPSLRRKVEAMSRDVYADAVGRAVIETLLSPRMFSPALPYSIEQIFERDLPANELSDQRPSRKKRL
jgi:hypothetical protein